MNVVVKQVRVKIPAISVSLLYYWDPRIFAPSSAIY